MRRIGVLSFFNPDMRSCSAIMTPMTKNLSACSGLICNKGDTVTASPRLGSPAIVDPTAWHSFSAIQSTISSSSISLFSNFSQLSSRIGSLLASRYRSTSWVWRLAITECITSRCLSETASHAPGRGTCSPLERNIGPKHAITESKIWWNTELGPLGCPLESCVR